MAFCARGCQHQRTQTRHDDVHIGKRQRHGQTRMSDIGWSQLPGVDVIQVRFKHPCTMLENGKLHKYLPG
jgi:hypothetical protein